MSLADSHSSEEYNPFYVVIDCQLDEDTNRRDIIIINIIIISTKL